MLRMYYVLLRFDYALLRFTRYKLRKSECHVRTVFLVRTWHGPGPEVIKLFSCSAQLSMKFQLLINAEIVKISGKFRFTPQN